MCGVAGFLNSALNADEKTYRIQQMLAQLQHRGPDGWGTYVAPHVALGHTRLSILDHRGGTQPMRRNRFVISYNGEIFNYIELRNQLLTRGYSFTTHSDTEVVLACFEAFGVDAFKKFNGQFALLIWDTVEQKLYAARDRYGIRPLYVLNYKNAFYFSSEMKAFDTLPDFQREYDISHLFEHALLWNTLGSETVYKQIESVSPGSYEVFSNGQRISRRYYYQLGETAAGFAGSYDQAKEELQDLLFDSVSLQLRSDVDVGCYLSGGVDSAIIAHLATHKMAKPLQTYSLAFSDAAYDESQYQALMAREINSRHHELKITDENINAAFVNSITHMERPVFRTAPVPLSLLSQAVQNNGVKVVLTGEGADEIFFGYDSFKEEKLLQFWNKFPESVYRPLLIKRLYPHLKHYSEDKHYGLMKMYYENFLGRKNRIAGLDIRLHNNKSIASYLRKDHNVVFDEELLTQKIKQELPEHYNDWSLGRQQQYMEMKTLLSGYLLSSQGDRMSMSHSVEGRYPFLDHRLVEFAFSLPDTFKLKGFSQKHILRDAYKSIIPQSIIDRPKLPYQSPDLKSFFKNGRLYGVAEHFLSPEMIQSCGIFELKLVQRLLKKYEDRTPDQIGYRDNMSIVFMLSAHVAVDCAKHVKISLLPEALRDVNLSDFTSGDVYQ